MTVWADEERALRDEAMRLAGEIRRAVIRAGRNSGEPSHFLDWYIDKVEGDRRLPSVQDMASLAVDVTALLDVADRYRSRANLNGNRTHRATWNAYERQKLHKPINELHRLRRRIDGQIALRRLAG